MAWFKVMIKGERFLANIDNCESRVGFFVTRFAEAENAEDATLAALKQIRGDSPKHFRLRPDAARPSTLAVEQVDMVDESDVADVAPGYVFYPLDDVLDGPQ